MCFYDRNMIVQFCVKYMLVVFINRLLTNIVSMCGELFRGALGIK